jgi:hypothetical protein
MSDEVTVCVEVIVCAEVALDELGASVPITETARAPPCRACGAHLPHRRVQRV